MDKGLHIENQPDFRFAYLGLALALIHRPVEARAVLCRLQTDCRSSERAPLHHAEAAAATARTAINWRTVEQHIRWEQENPEHHILLSCEATFPRLLRDIGDSPHVLFVQGCRAALTRPQVAMVGSRKATHLGLVNARDLAALIAKAGFIVTSGLALGIDGECHRTALSAGGGTIAVLGSGINVNYPRRHHALRGEIRSNGALVSEFPLDTPPKPFHFPRRNRIISGLSIALIVVEAGKKSGSLTSAVHAAEQGREVYAVPGSIRHASAAGCNYLISEGAQVVFESSSLIDSLSQSCRLYFPDFEITNSDELEHQNKANKATRALGAIERRVLSLLSPDPVSFDELVALSGLTSSELSSILSALELGGFIRGFAGSTYSLA